MRIDPDTPVKLMLRSKFKLGVSFNTGADQNTVKINNTAALKSYQPLPTSSWWPFLPFAGDMEGDGRFVIWGI